MNIPADSSQKLLQVKAFALSRCSDDVDLSKKDIDEIVFYLLEKLNDYSQQLNQLSNSKENLEKQLKCLNRCFLKQASKIKITFGNRTLTLIEVYFEKMLRLGMRQLELQHYSSRKSDMEDELQMTALIIEQFDMDLLSGVWFHGQNVTHDPNSIGQLAANLLPPSNILLKKHSGKEVNLEIIEQMKQKMRLISEQLSSLQDKIKNITTKQQQDRTSFNRFCQLKKAELQPVIAFSAEYFDARMSQLMLKPKLDKLNTNIDRIRRTYSATMNDLHLVSCFIRQHGLERAPES